MTVAVVVTFAASAIIGFLVGRTVVAVVPVIALGVFYAGLKAGLWGTGVGDGWYYAMVILMAVSVGGVLLGIVTRSVLVGASPRRPA
jgi:hypothetical protein